MSAKADAARMVVLLDAIARERKRRGVPEKPRPRSVVGTVRKPASSAAGSPAVVEGYYVVNGLAIFDRFGVDAPNGTVVADRVVHVSGPELTEGDALPYEMLRYSNGQPISSDPPESPV